MASSKEQYEIDVHYPKTKEDVYELRKRMGIAYSDFVKDYVLTLPISDAMKNKMYEEITYNLNKNR